MKIIFTGTMEDFRTLVREFEANDISINAQPADVGVEARNAGTDGLVAFAIWVKDAAGTAMVGVAVNAMVAKARKAFKDRRSDAQIDSVD